MPTRCPTGSPSRGAWHGVGPAREFGAYRVTFDNRSLAAGERIDAGPGVTSIRRC